MKPVPMLRFGGPDVPPEEQGDCLRACFCSLLEIEPDQLDCFHGDGWWESYWEALEPFGVYPITVEARAPLPGFWIGCAPSVNFEGVTHAVVMHGDTVVHDPSPGKKVVTVSYPNEGIVLVPFDVAEGALR